MSGLILLYLGAPLTVAVAVRRTMPCDDRPAEWHERAGRLLLGLVAYPAVVALVFYSLRGSDIGAGSIALFTLPGLAFGVIVGRMWIVGVPPVAAATTLLISYAMDPSCATSYGPDDTWTVIVLMTMLWLVVPAAFTLLLGILARNLLSRLASRRRPSRRRRPPSAPSSTTGATHRA